MEGSGSKKILVVDDDADIRSVVCSVVTMLDCIPVEACDGEEALELAQSEKPDLIVLDVMMPVVDGNEVCRILKGSEEGQMVPIIMLTARDNLKDKVSSLEGGADDYLTKPFHYQELQARIIALLRIRELTLHLKEKSEELARMQALLIKAERQSAVSELAGSAAHRLGQPLSAIILNCHLLQKLLPATDKARDIAQAIKDDASRMSELIKRLKSADASKRTEYFAKENILEIEE